MSKYTHILLDQPQTLVGSKPWASRDLDVPFLGLTGHRSDRLTYGNLCEGLFAFGQTGSGKSSALKTIANTLMKRGLGWFGLAVKLTDVIDQLQWAYDADRIKLHPEDDGEDTQRVVGGVYVLGPHPGRQKHYPITDKNGETLNLVIEDAQLNFLEAEMQDVPMATQSHFGPKDRLSNVAATITSAAAMQGNGGQDKDLIWGKAATILLEHLLVITWELHGKLDIRTISSLAKSMPRDAEDMASKEWRSGALFCAMRDIRAQYSEEADMPLNVRLALEHCIEDFLKWPPQTGFSVIFHLQATLGALEREALSTMMCGRTTIPAEAIRTGTVFIAGMQIKDLNDLAKMSGLIYKRTFQRILEKCQLGKGVVMWTDECQAYMNPSVDSEFQATARSSRTIVVNITQNLPALTQHCGGGDGGKAAALGLIGNLVTTIFFLNKDTETNEWASNTIGKDYRTVISRSETGNTGGGPGGFSVNKNRVNEHLVMPVVFSGLRSGSKANSLTVEAILFRAGSKFSTGNKFLKIKFHQATMGATGAFPRLEMALRSLLGLENFVYPIPQGRGFVYSRWAHLRERIRRLFCKNG